MSQSLEGVTPELAALLEALVSLKDPATAHALLQDLCTPRELEDMAQRLEVARMLDAGVVYARIQAATGASATTVARVARCLKYGSGGYRAVLASLPPYEEGAGLPRSGVGGQAGPRPAGAQAPGKPPAP